MLKIPDADYLDINSLVRQDFDMLYHPNRELAPKLQHISCQIYLLKGTIYGCFVVEQAAGNLDIQWFGYRYTLDKEHLGCFTPVSTLELYEVLENCDPEKCEELLFNLDVLSGKGMKE